jgi:hypothetical protein
MCSVSTSRSAPATSTPSSLSERMMASNSGPRWRTSTRMSPGRAPFWIQSRMLRAIFCASRVCGLVSVTSSNGASQASISRLASGLTASQISTVPGTASGSASCTVFTSSAESPLCACGRANTVSTASSRVAPERNEWRNGMYCSSCSMPRQSRSKVRRMPSNSRGAAPWNEKIDCFSSPTANTVRVTARAPAPTKNSPVNASMIRHCRGLVSCASSIST